jgi:type VI secretion system protein ImpM
MSEALVNGAPGWFGKMPGAGDFASRRLPDSFVRGWDDWLQNGLVASRDALGASWLEHYLVAPVLRFWVAPGVLDASAWAGVVMPSVDRVGRHFPLTIAQPSGALDGALAAREWYRAIDAIARRVLHVDATIEALENELAGAVAAEVPVAADLTRLARRLQQQVEPARHCSVWWCDDASARSHFLCFDGLPPADAFVSALGASPR